MNDRIGLSTICREAYSTYYSPALSLCPERRGFALCLLLVKKILTTWVNVNLNKLICFCLPAIICSGCGEALTESEQRARKLTHPDSKLRFLAESGIVECQTTLAHCYCDLQQYKEAMKWMRLAADQGYANAQYNLGLWYESGQGVPINNVEAYARFSAAAAGGYGKAVSARDNAAKQLAPEQLAQGQKRATELLEKIGSGK